MALHLMGAAPKRREGVSDQRQRVVSCVASVDPGSADYLHQHALRVRRTALLPSTAWQALAEHSDPDDVRYLATAAYRRMQYRYAAAFYPRLDPRYTTIVWDITTYPGDPSLDKWLADLLGRQGRTEELRARSEVGDVWATQNLANLLVKRGDIDESLQLMRHRAEAGDQRTHAATLALFSEYAAQFNRTGMAALPASDGSLLAEAAQATIPDWESLFGTFDLCACDECASVHSPAAYLVDVLQFLADRDARGPLFERRPDLGDVELSCENTNTPVPVIDLVNEVLENAVAPPPPFAPVTLDAGLEADLTAGVVSPELAAAFAPRLHGGASVEVIEPGGRWRVWDEAFAYSVAKDGSQLQVVARSRQTLGPDTKRRAEPQYLNRAAYEELSRSIHPWNLPFDLPREEATLFLQQLGVTRRELMEALGPLGDESAERAVGLAAERLGLSEPEYRLLVAKALDPPHAPQVAGG
jgi:hypothetical protein